jgi:hypothetical protein
MKQGNVPGSLEGYLIAYLIESLDDQDICIYGDPKGLRSLGEAIIAIANLDQKTLPDQQCPANESFHQHYVTGLKIADHERERLFRLTIGRVDEKASGRIREVFPPMAKSRQRQ